VGFLNNIPNDMTIEQVNNLDETYNKEYGYLTQREMIKYSEDSNQFNIILRNENFEKLLNKK
jgi:hypothetical protein